MYQEQRMTVAKSHEKAHDVFKDWFRGMYPESELRELIVHQTVGDVDDVVRSPCQTESPVSHGGWFPPETLPVDLGEGYSNNVLIDMDGSRNHYSIGWYDHDESKWFFQGDDSFFHPTAMRWSNLPLTK